VFLTKTALAAAVAISIAAAPCSAQDRWTTGDKVEHVMYSCGAGVASSAILGPEHPWWSFGLAMVPGVRKEWYDQKHKAAQGNGWSWKDIGADAVGAGLCVGGMNYAFRRGQNGGYQMTISWELP
jgi:uncharacterized protein YfiM (DUF2279 family)